MITVSMRRPRNPKAVNPDDPFIVAKGWGYQLRAIESHPDIHRAQHARDILAEHEQEHGRSPNSIRIFRACDVRWMRVEEVSK